jgi:Domain of unknown function (DUF4326)
MRRKPHTEAERREKFEHREAKRNPPLLHVMPKADACPHDFSGWKAFEDGSGGEQICSKWGNPFVVGAPCGIFDGKEGRPLGLRDQVEVLVPALSLEQAIEFYRNALEGFLKPEMYPTGHAYRDRIRHYDLRFHLHGRDLACWCALDQPCHADVLLEIANQ